MVKTHPLFENHPHRALREKPIRDRESLRFWFKDRASKYEIEMKVESHALTTTLSISPILNLLFNYQSNPILLVSRLLMINLTIDKIL